jgi:hypothetical protein
MSVHLTASLSSAVLVAQNACHWPWSIKLRQNLNEMGCLHLNEMGGMSHAASYYTVVSSNKIYYICQHAGSFVAVFCWFTSVSPVCNSFSTKLCTFGLSRMQECNRVLFHLLAVTFCDANHHHCIYNAMLAVDLSICSLCWFAWFAWFGSCVGLVGLVVVFWTGSPIELAPDSVSHSGPY